MRMVTMAALVASALPALGVFIPVAASAQGQGFPWGFELRAAGSLGFTYDDNALLGRRGQFLNAQFLNAGGTSGRVTGVSLPRLVLELEAGRELEDGDRLGIGARLDLGLAHTVEELAGYDFIAAASYRKTLGPDGLIEPELRFAYHSQDAAWTNRVFQPRIRARYFFDFGLVAELRYSFTATQFARQVNGQFDPKNSYGNIDRMNHSAELDLSIWPHSMFRLELVVDFQATEYDGALTARLAQLTGLGSETARSDAGGGVSLAALLTPVPELLVSSGVRCDANFSNSAPFTFTACRFLAGGLVRIAGQHGITAEFEYGRYDFPDARFDRRYSNTRVDFRRTFGVGYRVGISEMLLIRIRYRRIDSVSNDCADFDSTVDAEGIPVNSWSFSCFEDNRIEATVQFNVDAS